MDVDMDYYSLRAGCVCVRNHARKLTFITTHEPFMR